LSRAVLILIAFVALIRLPFLDQAFQLDDYYYLKAANHALADPLHPHHARYVFLGIEFDMRGHPHPPGNAWILALLLALFGGAHEIPLHTAWMVFTAGAVWAAYAIAKRFCPENALDVTLLASSAPVFITAGNSFFTDLPFICFWTAAIAFGLDAGEKRSRALACAASLAIASAISYQAAVAIPVLALFWWRRGALSRLWWILSAPVLVIGGYQVFEGWTGGAMPVQVLSGHFRQFGLQRFEMKLKNAVALTAHLAWMASPVLVFAMLRGMRRALWAVPLAAFGIGLFLDGSPLFWLPFTCGAVVLLWVARAPDLELKLWFGIYFLAALVIFFAGAARYMLPAMLPLALLAGRSFSGRPWLLRAATVLNLLLGLSLAWVSYEHWGAYRDLARQWQPRDGRLWVNAEWGLREYTERQGARPLLRGAAIAPADLLINSALAEQIGYSMAGADPVMVRQELIRPTLPLRMMGLGSRSSYETVGFGLRPIDIATSPVDVVTLTRFDEHLAELSWLRVAAPGASSQIVSGVYPRENPDWRWTARSALFILKNPGGRVRLRAEGALPDSAPGREVRLMVAGATVKALKLDGPGPVVVESEPFIPAGHQTTVELRIDQDFEPGGGDRRRLGMIVSAIGFVPSSEPPGRPKPARR
jgi:hypothetical protein